MTDQTKSSGNKNEQLALPFNDAAPYIGTQSLDDVRKQYPPADALAQKLKFRIVLRHKARLSAQNSDHVIFPHPEKHEGIVFNSYKDCVEAAIKLGISLKNADLRETHNSFNELDLSDEEKSLIKTKISLQNGVYDGADFRNVICERVNFSNSSLRHVDFSGDIDPISINKKEHHHRMLSEMARVVFDGCDLSHTKFINCILDNASFGRAMDDNGAMINPALDHTVLKESQANNIKIDRASVKAINWQGERFYNFTVHDVDFREMTAFPIFQIDTMRGCQFAQGLRPTGTKTPALVSRIKTDARF